MAILRLEEVMKTYGKQVAVNSVSFAVPEGAIFGLLGPNGAGKTSLIRIITTITKADSGQVHFDGERLGSRHPARIGYMPEERGLYKKMHVGEHLKYLARLKGLSRQQADEQINYWFEKFGILDWYEKKVEELSKGMQQKIQFISTVIHNPRLLILDEPFSGLDPINTNLIKHEIRQLNERGTSIIFSTHRMEQVEEMCEDIVLINKGENVLQGRVRALKEQFKENRFRVEYEGELPEGLLDIAQLEEQHNGQVVFRLQADHSPNELLRHLLDKGLVIHGFNELLPTLNEIFIKQVNESSAAKLPEA